MFFLVFIGIKEWTCEDKSCKTVDLIVLVHEITWMKRERMYLDWQNSIVHRRGRPFNSIASSALLLTSDALRIRLILVLVRRSLIKTRARLHFFRLF